MKRSLLVFFIFWSPLSCLSQSDSSVVSTFRSIKKKELNTHLNLSKVLNFDFRVIDLAQFDALSNKENIAITWLKPAFDLMNTNGEKVKLMFDCTNKDLNDCAFNGKFYSLFYFGASQITDIHVVAEVREIGSLYLIDPNTESVVSVPCDLDGGYIPVFTSDYLILYSSIDYDGPESIITVYKMNNYEGDDILKRFEYVGNFFSNNWTIDELYASEKENSFTLKIKDADGKTFFLEMKIKA